MTDRWRVLTADCLSLEGMAGMPDDSIDAAVCDPPYGLAFMGKEWDHGVPGIPFWTEALRVAKPGAHLVAFGGTRTYHRLTCAIEDAGWEIRDCLMWLYGSGFPKSLDVSKSLDGAAGAERDRTTRAAFGGTFSDDNGTTYGTVLSGEPITDAAKEWQGWGTALKPAWEPIILARKPLVGTVVQNVTAHGTGALNIDGCRIGTGDDLNGGAYTQDAAPRHDGKENWRYERGKAGEFAQPAGRWPANVILDEAAGAMLDAQSGESISTGTRSGNADGNGIYGRGFPRDGGGETGFGDSGGASRFFYCAKASRGEREAGLEGMSRGTKNWSSGDQSPGTFQAEGTDRTSTNHHPTVKPIDLMRWLCRLVTPPGGLILDPFTGSGTTGCAAMLEGFRFVGIEKEAEYAEIARRRIAHWLEVSKLPPSMRDGLTKPDPEEPGTLDLFHVEHPTV